VISGAWIGAEVHLFTWHHPARYTTKIWAQVVRHPLISLSNEATHQPVASLKQKAAFMP